ncbi:hypothetical protein HHI36_017032, partial [Cryptolaemus montrouzieri]
LTAQASNFPNPSSQSEFFRRTGTVEFVSEQGKLGLRGGRGQCIDYRELDKVLVTSDTSEIAVYGDYFGGCGPDVISYGFRVERT